MTVLPSSRRRRSIAIALGALALPASRRALAADAYPSRPIHIVVPFPPGGTTDYVTRLVGAEMAPGLGQTVIVDNRPGAGTVIGVDAVAKSPADGYALVTVANSYTVNRTLVKKLPYGLADLRPVALMGRSDHVLATHPGSGFRTLAELRAYAKANPGKLSYASFGNGTSAHLAGEMLKLALGADIVHVPYKGQGPALADLLGGQVTLMFGNWPEFRSHIRAGKLIAVGMATLERSQFAPDIATLAEQGVSIESNSWNGLLAPAGTPDAVVQRMNAAVNQALAGAAVSAAFDQGGIRSLARTPQQFAAFIASEIEKYATVIRAAGITTG